MALILGKRFCAANKLTRLRPIEIRNIEDEAIGLFDLLIKIPKFMRDLLS